MSSVGMGRLTALVGTLFLISACGGHAKSDSLGDGTAGGTAAGGTAAGGTAAGGTAPTEPTSPPIEPIDDMQLDGGGNYPRLSPGSSSFFWRGGLGNWFVTSSDGVSRDAPIEPIDALHPESGTACHVSGGQGIGVDLFAQLNHPTGGPVDLSAYSGIVFRARWGAPRSALIVAFGAQGEFLKSPKTFASRTLNISEEWQQFELSFADFKLNPSAISSVDFVVDRGADAFDLWVADLGLICTGTCP